MKLSRGTRGNFNKVARYQRAVAVLGFVLLSKGQNTSDPQNNLTQPHPTPILGREALLSLVEWMNTMRRTQDERTRTEELGLRNNYSGGSQTPDRGAVGPHDAAVSDSNHPEQGAHGEDGA
jgi:hypothetical protein